MTYKEVRLYSCDELECSNTTIGNDPSWWFMRGWGHFCPAHNRRPCEKCNNPMRRQDVKIADQPGTKRYGGRGLCHSCLREKSPIVTISNDHAKYIRRLAEQRLSGDDYLLVLDAFGIGDDTV